MLSIYTTLLELQISLHAAPIAEKAGKKAFAKRNDMGTLKESRTLNVYWLRNVNCKQQHQQQHQIENQRKVNDRLRMCKSKNKTSNSIIMTNDRETQSIGKTFIFNNNATDQNLMKKMYDKKS